MKRLVVLLVAALTVLVAAAPAAAAAPRRIDSTPTLPDDARPIDLGSGFTLLYADLRPPGRGDGGTPHLTAEVRYAGEARVDAPFLKAVFRDAAGNVVGVESVSPVQHVAEPGKRLVYDAQASRSDPVALRTHATIEWSLCRGWADAILASQMPMPLSVVGVAERLVSGDRLQLVVTVRNDGDGPANYAAAAVALYDAHRHLLQASYDAVGARLEAGQTGIVTLSATPRAPDYTYRVFAYAGGGVNAAIC